MKILIHFYMEVNFETETVGEVVRKDYRASKVFKKHHIDFCCGGDKTIRQVCSERRLSEDELRAELRSVLNNSPEGTLDFDSWSLDLLADYIEKKHHRYVEETVPLLRQYLKKLVAVHSNAAPYLSELSALFTESSGNLVQHMKKEELVLFPFIRKMAETQAAGAALAPPHFGTVENPIAVMQDDHEQEGEHFRKMELISGGFTIPEWACNTFAVTMNLLREFQDDLHMHIHLENNILFPKALELERTLLPTEPSPSACSLRLPNMP